MLSRLSAITAAVLLGIAPAAQAGGYLGVGLGAVDYELPSFEDGAAFEFIGGYEISRALAVEVSYLDLGEAGDNIPPEWFVSGSAMTVGILLKAPLTPGLELFARLGAHQWDLRLDEDGGGRIAEDDGADGFVGFGANVRLTGNADLGLRYTRYAIDQDRIGVLTGTAMLRF